MNPFERRLRGSGRVTAAAPNGGASAAVIPLASRARDFMVLTGQRTGSSWLMDRLDHSPEVEGHMELFYHLERREPARAGCNDYPRFVESRDSHAAGVRPMAVFRYLDQLYARRHAVGFKLMYSQLREYPEILAWLVWRRLPIVHLLRANHLDVVISERLAEATGTSHATVNEGTTGQPLQLHLDPDAIVLRIRWLERKQRAMRRLLKLLPNSCLEVSYEALCDQRAAFDSLYAFLHIDRALVREDSKLVKRQCASHDEVIENHEAVRNALIRAGYGALWRDRHTP